MLTKAILLTGTNTPCGWYSCTAAIGLRITR